MNNVGPKKPDLYDRVTKALIVAIGIIGLSQDKTAWFPYVLFGAVIFLSSPFFVQVLRRITRWRKRKKAVDKFSQEDKWKKYQGSIIVIIAMIVALAMIWLTVKHLVGVSEAIKALANAISNGGQHL